MAPHALRCARCHDGVAGACDDMATEQPSNFLQRKMAPLALRRVRCDDGVAAGVVELCAGSEGTTDDLKVSDQEKTRMKYFHWIATDTRCMQCVQSTDVVW